MSPARMVRRVSEARGRGWHSDSTGGTSKCRGREEGRHPCVLEQLGWTEAREWVGPDGLHWKLQEPSAGWQVCYLLSGDCPGGCIQMAELGEWLGSLLLPLRSPRGGLGFSKATSGYHNRWRKACLGCPQLIPKGWPMPCSARCSNDNRWCPWKQSKSRGQNVCPGSACEVERRSASATEAQRGMCPRSQDLQEGKTWVQEGKAPPWETPSLTPYSFVSFQRQPHQPAVGQGSGQVLAPPCFTPHASPPIPHHCS
ncbi:unnamed protein product [Rangifer tarandus platyrhynchus]|uniref:Uncharacterized protein n=2 Tax=Rangifer tarandus platyrhynchus TaxID=3082113 RepID=A0ABN8YQ28_RANTA|nr:unnamed protein product [Rangifer tarandus platyrhynchus]